MNYGAPWPQRGGCWRPGPCGCPELVRTSEGTVCLQQVAPAHSRGPRSQQDVADSSRAGLHLYRSVTGSVGAARAPPALAVTLQEHMNVASPSGLALFFISFYSVHWETGPLGEHLSEALPPLWTQGPTNITSLCGLLGAPNPQAHWLAEMLSGGVGGVRGPATRGERCVREYVIREHI